MTLYRYQKISVWKNSFRFANLMSLSKMPKRFFDFKCPSKFSIIGLRMLTIKWNCLPWHEKKKKKKSTWVCGVLSIPIANRRNLERIKKKRSENKNKNGRRKERKLLASDVNWRITTQAFIIHYIFFEKTSPLVKKLVRLLEFLFALYLLAIIEKFSIVLLKKNFPSVTLKNWSFINQIK